MTYPKMRQIAYHFAMSRWLPLLRMAAVAALLFLAVYQLPAYPLTWYDEGSHLHVPKTLIQHGLYADWSSEGPRYYGPTLGVGPTVMLPIAGVFGVAGVGLVQARLVMVAYLLVAVWLMYRLGVQLGGPALGALAALLLVSVRGIGLLEYGRQVLGEVPALAFLLAGLAVWFAEWERARPLPLLAAGLLMGLAVITKAQFLILIGPALALGLVLNAVYDRNRPHTLYLLPGLMVGGLYVLWQVVLVAFLGPGNPAENWAQLRAATASAATVFRPDLMAQALGEVLDPDVFLWLLPVPVLWMAWGARARTPQAQQWRILLLMLGVNLTWYILASVGWPRYAFGALALAAVPVAAWLLSGLKHLPALWQTWQARTSFDFKAGWWPLVSAALTAGMVLMLGARTAWPILTAGANPPQQMADYLNAHVPPTAIIETWEPELGFLTDHTYHFPEQLRLYQAVSYIWADGAPPNTGYTFIAESRPEYVIVGPFAAYVGMYTPEMLADYIAIPTDVPNYTLWQRR